MYCMSCGRALKAELRFCDGCGTEVPTAVVGAVSGVATATLTGQLRQEVQGRSLDAWQGIRMFLKSPVAGLGESYAGFDEKRAMQVGLTFTAFYLIAFMAGLLIFRNRVIDSFAVFVLVGGDMTISQFFKLVLIGLAPVGSLAATIAVARVALGGTGTFAGDLYTAGAVAVPWGLLVFIGSLVGVANLEVPLLLATFALSYSILMLYAGCTRIVHIAESTAGPVVPVIFLASAWIAKVIITAIL